MNENGIKSEVPVKDKYVGHDGLFHYTACGLDNIYLKSGFNISSDGMSYSISQLEDLHSCISMFLVNNTQKLNGDELKFLRKELNLTQSQVAKLVGVDTQTVARWEKEECKNLMGDRFMRALYLSRKGPEGIKLYDFLESISDLDIKEHNKWLFEQEEKWQKIAA